mgnify:CR=1 FL=1
MNVYVNKRRIYFNIYNAHGESFGRNVRNVRLLYSRLRRLTFYVSSVNKEVLKIAIDLAVIGSSAISAYRYSLKGAVYLKQGFGKISAEQIKEIAQALGYGYKQANKEPVTGVAIDSRTVKPGDLLNIEIVNKSGERKQLRVKALEDAGTSSYPKSEEELPDLPNP